jgi:hypothetical protein
MSYTKRMASRAAYAAKMHEAKVVSSEKADPCFVAFHGLSMVPSFQIPKYLSHMIMHVWLIYMYDI